MDLWHLFLLVLSLTAFSFGGGQALQTGLERELVATGIMSPADYVGAVALGHATPGPLASFTTAMGNSLFGVPGALVATAAMAVVSLTAVWLIGRVPAAWFRRPTIAGALALVPYVIVSMMCFLALRMGMEGNAVRLAAPMVIVGLAFGARLLKAPNWAIVLGGVAVGMALQGTQLAGW